MPTALAIGVSPLGMVAAFPAVVHATLARIRAKGRKPSELEARLRLFLAVARGRV